MTEYPTWHRDDFVIATDPATTDLDAVCGFLATSYWAKDLAREHIERSFAASLVYNLIDEGERRQVGFSRVVTDYTRMAWLSDVFVLNAYRGRGLGKWLVKTVIDDPRLADARGWILATADAHGLYEQFGWQHVAAGRYMTLLR